MQDRVSPPASASAEATTGAPSDAPTGRYDSMLDRARDLLGDAAYKRNPPNRS